MRMMPLRHIPSSVQETLAEGVQLVYQTATAADFRSEETTDSEVFRKYTELCATTVTSTCFGTSSATLLAKVLLSSSLADHNHAGPSVSSHRKRTVRSTQDSVDSYEKQVEVTHEPGNDKPNKNQSRCHVSRMHPIRQRHSDRQASTTFNSKKIYGREESQTQWVEGSGLAFRKLTHNGWY
ncbi:hypothetical protein Tco_0922350 [Tanacetum coccineum]|uniref:Uncharacterized protein n=1 Tax=Tanacetum coccineum TaxID=301880 RepID=A0ABQ5CXZ7_9ASTR